jgi:hypothetical protein
MLIGHSYVHVNSLILVDSYRKRPLIGIFLRRYRGSLTEKRAFTGRKELVSPLSRHLKRACDTRFRGVEMPMSYRLSATDTPSDEPDKDLGAEVC